MLSALLAFVRRDTSVGVVLRLRPDDAYARLFAVLAPRWLVGCTLLAGDLGDGFCIAIRYARPHQIARIRWALAVTELELLPASKLVGLPLVESCRVERDIVVVADDAITRVWRRDRDSRGTPTFR